MMGNFEIISRKNLLTFLSLPQNVLPQSQNLSQLAIEWILWSFYKWKLNRNATFSGPGDLEDLPLREELGPRAQWEI